MVQMHNYVITILMVQIHNYIIIFEIKQIQQNHNTQDSFVSAWIKSIGIDVSDCLEHPLEDLDPHKHLMDERKREKDKQRLIHLITAA